MVREEFLELIRNMEKALQHLAIWQEEEAERCDGERYERDMLRTAPTMFHGGQGGTPDQPWVRQRLAKLLKPLFVNDVFPEKENPFLADLFWWKGEQIAVVEISRHVSGDDIYRAAKRADMLRRVGAHVIPAVIGRDWASENSRYQAQAEHVEWKVGSDLSDGFIQFRRVPAD